MLPLGTVAPNFKLPDTISGEQTLLSEVKGTKGTLIIFMCNHFLIFGQSVLQFRKVE